MDIPKAPLERLVDFFQSKALRVKDFYEDYAHGWLSWIVGFFAAIYRWYRRVIWDRFARNSDGDLTSKRVSATIGATLFVLWLLPSLLLAVWQVGLMATTWNGPQKVYLTNAEEIDPDAELWSIRGCTVIPCGEKDAIYFRVRPSWAHDVYSLITRGYFFYPEEVAAVVAPGVNECVLDASYGIRIRALMRGWGIYPDLLDAICTPYEASTLFTSPDKN